MRYVMTFLAFIAFAATFPIAVGLIFAGAYTGTALHEPLGLDRAVAGFGGTVLGMAACGMMMYKIIMPFSNWIEIRLREIF